MDLAKPFTDYSGYSAFQQCRWLWYEKYVNGLRKAWPQQQRDDALCLGSLVHSGLEGFYKSGASVPPEKVVAENTPTRDCYNTAMRLINNYIKHFPGEQWKLNFTEEPLRFPVIEGWDGLAKLDRYFYVDEPTRVNQGMEGMDIVLNPGWWIHEYKTKSPYVDRADWMKEWNTKMQADFQMLALTHRLMSTRVVGENEIDGLAHTKVVRGILVNVLEKPKEYVPKRKCQQCQQYWPFANWTAVAGTTYGCPVCGNQQKLKPVKIEDFENDEPICFRIVVERRPDQLGEALAQIRQVAAEMKGLVAGGMNSVAANKENCLNLNKRYGKECDFYRPHNYGLVTVGNPEYRKMEDYVAEQAV